MNLSSKRHKQGLELAAVALALTLALAPSSARADGDWHLGASLGFGGTGISTTAQVNSTQTPIERGEGPGVFSLFIDYLISDRYELSFEHIRGFKLGPFSSGVAFTGFAGRWFFWGPAPSVPKVSGESTTVTVKRFAPFLGLGLGVAGGTITREADQVPSVSGSGVYFGFRLGAEYPLSAGVGLRPEITSLSTISSSSTLPSSVSEFGLQLGLYFYL